MPPVNILALTVIAPCGSLRVGMIRSTVVREAKTHTSGGSDGTIGYHSVCETARRCPSGTPTSLLDGGGE